MDRLPNSMPRTARKDASRLALALAAAIFGVVVSGVLLLRHYGLDAGALAAAVCDPANSGCEAVAASAWSAVAGVPLAAVGLAFFASLGVLLGLALFGGFPLSGRPGRLALLLVSLGLVADVFLFGVQAFSIGAFCSLCLWTYAAGGLAFVCLLPARRKDRAPAPRLARERLALRAFWLAAGMVVAAVLLLNNGLSRRAAESPDLSILGVRSGTAPPAEAWSSRISRMPVLAAGAAPQWRNPTFRQQRPREVPVEGVPFRGDPEAPVKIVTFSDFLCPSCRRFALAFDQYAEGPTGHHVTLYYRSFPLDRTCVAHLPRVLHPGACEVARGAACAHRLGSFWDYHDAVYQAPPSGPSVADVTRIAVRAGMDREAFEACLAEPETEAALQSDIVEAVRLGVTGTPTIFINGRQVPSLDEFADAVLWELEKAGIEAPDPGPEGE